MQNLGLSKSTPKPTSRLRELCWPDVSDEVGARTAAQQASWVCFIVAGLTTILTLVGYLRAEALLDAILFAAAGVGIRRLSRVAAVAGLALYVLEQVYNLTAMKRPPGIVAIIVTFLLISAVRGSFAYHRLRRSAAAAGPEQPTAQTPAAAPNLD